jgi:opacity protein-like surface antigen
MKNIVSLAIAAALALAGVSAAAANQMSNHASKMSGASDQLTLSDTQQKSIWKDVSRQASNQSAPSGFNATVGTAVPSSVSTYPLPLQARRDVPQVRPYRYAMTQDKVLIVNPSDHKIADVVTK